MTQSHQRSHQDQHQVPDGAFCSQLSVSPSRIESSLESRVWTCFCLTDDQHWLIWTLYWVASCCCGTSVIKHSSESLLPSIHDFSSRTPAFFYWSLSLAYCNLVSFSLEILWRPTLKDGEDKKHLSINQGGGIKEEPPRNATTSQRSLRQRTSFLGWKKPCWLSWGDTHKSQSPRVMSSLTFLQAHRISPKYSGRNWLERTKVAAP